ncbi:MAG: penicillin-insensitive murein endopeptidase [Deltaproteobacteria bacterium]|nr:penicillin-insensitive murein endopeptidase [Deltaproteobacteria bacterium]
MRRLLGLSLSLALAVTVSGTARAQEVQEAPDGESGVGASHVAALAAADSLSTGHADGGRLEHAFALRTGDALATVSRKRYGTRELVGLLGRAASAVARAFPGSRLAVGDLSSEDGGPLAPHESHQSGRDADVAFYLIGADGQAVPQALFQRVDADGRARRSGRRFTFDDARNWALLVAFVDDPMAEVQYVILAPHIRERLLEYGRRIEAPEDQLRRVELVTRRMRGSDGHDDHFHVRIYCSVGDRPQCLDRPPLHPWYYGTPSPDAVAAARVADLQRAQRLRRDQEQAHRAELALARGAAREEAREQARARALLAEPSRQEHAEARRAARLTRDERRALGELRRLEEEAARLLVRSRVAELGRDSAAQAEERRWRANERRRSVRLREEQRRIEAEERRRAARLRRQDREAARLQRRAEAQQARDRRRAQRLMRRSEELARQRARMQ